VYPVVDHPINRMVPQSLRAGLAVASEPHSKCIRGQGDTVQNFARGRLARAFLGPAQESTRVKLSLMAGDTSTNARKFIPWTDGSSLAARKPIEKARFVL